MKKNKKLVLSIVFFVLMLVMTIYILFKDNDISEVISVAMSVNINYLVICAVLIVLYLLFEGLYLRITFKSLKQKTTLAKCFAYSCIEYYFSAITPSSTGGQPFQSYYMAKDGIPVTKSTIALILNTYTFKIVLLVLGVVCMILKPAVVFHNGVLFNVFLAFGVIVNLGIIIGCFLIMKSKRKVKKFVIWLVNLLGKLHLKKEPEKTIKKMDDYMADFKKGATYLKKHPMLTVKVLGLTLLQRLCMFSIGYIVYLAFGLTGFSYLDFLAIQVIIAIAIDSLPFPGGMGITEVMMLRIYLPVYGENLLTASVLLTRLFSYYFCLILSGTVVLINHIRVTMFDRKRIQKEEIEQ